MPVGAGIAHGKIYWGSDFTGIYDSVAWGATNLVSGDTWGAGIGFTSVNEGSFASSATLKGGVLNITSDTGDDDNAALVAGIFAPADGLMVTRARFQYNNLDCAIFVGFSSLMSLTTPVMPMEFATATMTYVAASQEVGFNYDVDGTTDDFRAGMGAGGAAISDSSNGIRSNMTTTVAKWIEAEVNVFPDGSAECWLGDVGHQNSASINRLRLIKRFTAGTLLTTTTAMYGVLMIENRSGNARILSVDYFEGEAGRSWTN